MNRKGFIIWLGGAALIFLVALQIFRTALPGNPDAGTTAPGDKQSESSSPAALAKADRTNRSGGDESGSPDQTLRVPPTMIELLTSPAFNPDTLEFSGEMQRILDLSTSERKGARSLFQTYFAAHANAELATAKVLREEEYPRRGHPDQERFIAVRIDPLGERLTDELTAMKSEFVGLLGRSRGLLAASLISHQLGNGGQGGELVSFIKYKNDERYAFEVRGLKKSRLRAAHYSGPAKYSAPDFTQLARYQHLATLLDQ